MLWNTYLVFDGTQNLKQVVKLLWTIKLPWHWAYHGESVAPWAAQFSFGFYDVVDNSSLNDPLSLMGYGAQGAFADDDLSLIALLTDLYNALCCFTENYISLNAE